MSNIIKDWLESATKKLQQADIESARLDAEIILSHTLKKSRTYLRAYRDEKIPSRLAEVADARLALRLERVPIAYIIGHKEFYGRTFYVNQSVLIPRPESETIITQLKKQVDSNQYKLVDVGTGSGCLGISAKLELPNLDVTLTDISPRALRVAEKNAKILKADVAILRSDLLSDYPFRVDFILANLPYVDESWHRSPETNHEPTEALIASGGGLSLIKKLISTASSKLSAGGLVILEADPRQHDEIIDFAISYDYGLADRTGFILTLKRAS